jgi:branched-chain amino acid transport system permease protein
MDIALQSAAYGGLLGVGQGLFAVALILTFRSTGFLNLSIGTVATASAYVVWDLWATGSVPLLGAMIVALAVAAILGLLTERVLRPLQHSTVVVKLVASLGVLLVTQYLVTAVWGTEERFLPLFISGGPQLGQVPLPWQQILLAALTIVAAGSLQLWVKRSMSGIASLAVAEDSTSARALGVPLQKVSAAVWVLSALLAGMVGLGLSGFGILNNTEMTLTMVTALAAALVAGFSNIPLAVVAAAGAGALTGGLSSLSSVSHVAGLKESLGFMIVLAVIVLRPSSVGRQLGRA